MQNNDALAARIKDIIETARPNIARAFPHWLEDGFFLLVRRQQIELYQSANRDSLNAELILKTTRDHGAFERVMQAISEKTDQPEEPSPGGLKP